MRTSLRLALIMTAGLMGSHCGGGANDQTAGSPASPSAGPTSATPADLAYCVQDINRYRASVGRRPYSESPTLEAFAAIGAQQDSATGSAHSHFIAVNGGGVALAENEFLDQVLTGRETVQEAIHIANALFFGEGPGGGHYEHSLHAGRVRRFSARCGYHRHGGFPVRAGGADRQRSCGSCAT
jgi:hypothetical protein